MTAVLADATNLALARMARSSGMFSHARLLWTAEWRLRDETYQAARSAWSMRSTLSRLPPSGARAILPHPMGSSSGPAAHFDRNKIPRISGTGH
jgi:hypothetical protein